METGQRSTRGRTGPPLTTKIQAGVKTMQHRHTVTTTEVGLGALGVQLAKQKESARSGSRLVLPSLTSVRAI